VADDLLPPLRRLLHVGDLRAGLERALAALWPNVSAQRCTAHKHRNLLAHAPDALHEEVSADYTDMIYAETAKEAQTRRKAFLRKWRLRCPAVATSLEEAGDRLLAFLRLPPSQWKCVHASGNDQGRWLWACLSARVPTQAILPMFQKLVTWHGNVPVTVFRHAEGCQ